MILDAFRLDGRVALVTGGNRGIGRAIATALAQAGADIALVGRGHPAETIAVVESLGRRSLVITADLSTAGPDALTDAVEAAADGLGRLDILVNNAGLIRRGAAVTHSSEDWDTVLRVDLDAVFHLCQAAGRIMLLQRHGKIINVASMLSYQGGIRVPSYTAAKHAVVGLTRALANEWATDGINVNAIAPGYIATDNTLALRNDPDRERAIRDRIPAGRWGEPEDLAGAAVFLASDAARYVHGAVLAVDGGWLAR